MYKLRIITGKWRNRKVTFYPSLQLKPTTDRVRETLFNWLQPVLLQAKCLDLFAGSGILSFEALSRGASNATIIEYDKKNANHIQQNSDILQAATTIYCQNALVFLKQTPENPYDIIFLDPPFNSDFLQKSLDLIFSNNWLTRDTGLLYCESAKQINFDARFTVHRAQKAGNVYFYLVIIPSDEGK